MNVFVFRTGSFDYFALNHYTTRYVTSGIGGPDPSWVRDRGVVASVDPSWPSSASSWLKVGSEMTNPDK